MFDERQEKAKLRASYKEIRQGLFSPARCEKIAERFFESELMRFQSFFVYLSFGSEVDTRAIVEGLLKREKRVLVPKIVGKEMIAVGFSDKLIKGKFGVSEPVSGEDELPQVCLTPLLAIDEKFIRLGYGGGYYDKYFARRSGVLRVGLAFEGQRVKMLPKEETDVPLDGLITENGFYLPNANLLTDGEETGIMKE